MQSQLCLTPLSLPINKKIKSYSRSWRPPPFHVLHGLRLFSVFASSLSRSGEPSRSSEESVVHRRDLTRRAWCTVEIRRGKRGAPSRSGEESVVHYRDPTRRAWCTVEIRRGERGAPLEGVHASPAKVVKVEHMNTLLVRYEYFIC